MAGIDKTADTAFTICWARGDNSPQSFTLTQNNAPLDISTQTFSMAVNTDKNPDNTTNQIFSVTGTFVTDGTDGQIEFTPPANSLDNVTAPGKAFYDINRLTPNKKTIIKGTVEFVMDIDKT